MHTTSRTLVLVRHARAASSAATDHDRPLTRSGETEAAAAGRWLAARGLVPDHVLVSTAVRAQDTWRVLAGAAGLATEQHALDALYEASPDAVLDLVHESPGDARCVVVVGHNPTIGQLAQLLHDGDGDREAAGRMTPGFPTGSLAVLTLEGEWTGLALGGARLEAFHVARA